MTDPARVQATRSQSDQEWAIERLRKNQAVAETNAGMFGAKLLKGHGYPDEVMCDAIDALALRIVLDLIASLHQERERLRAEVREAREGMAKMYAALGTVKLELTSTCVDGIPAWNWYLSSEQRAMVDRARALTAPETRETP